MYNIDFYLTDSITVISTAADINGVITQAAPVTHKARIEDTNVLIKDRNGKEVAANAFLMVEAIANIKYESLIQLKTINGVNSQDPDKKYPIKKLSRAHGFSNSHWEVWL